MRLDIYRRHEPGNKRSYLAVPAGRMIPPEATSTEWVAHARDTELDETCAEFREYGIEHPQRQLKEKGYAITSLSHQLQE
jgi:hypothetical protein